MALTFPEFVSNPPDGCIIAAVPMPARQSYRLVGAFSLYQQKRNLRPRTIAARRSALRSFVAFWGGNLLAASHTDIDAWLDSRPLTAKSRADYLSDLHCFYVWAIREELTERDPTLRIPAPRLHRRLPRPIAETDLEKAFANADIRMLAMLALAAYAGLRCMEIANLDVDDLCWVAPPLIFVREGKGAKDRVVPLGRRVELALSAYSLPSSGPVFPKRNGSHYAPGSVSTLINDHLRSCGIAATAHQLRHRFGTEFYRRCKDLRLTQEVMGHDNPATTALYTAWVMEDAARVVAEM